MDLSVAPGCSRRRHPQKHGAFRTTQPATWLQDGAFVHQDGMGYPNTSRGASSAGCELLG